VLSKIVKWVSLAGIALGAAMAVPQGSPILLLGFGVCAGAILAAQARRAAKYFWEAGDTRFSREVKYEN
jgi:hypothetical protein